MGAVSKKDTGDRAIPDRGSDPVAPESKKRRGLLAPDEPIEGAPTTRVRVARPAYDPAEGRGIIVVSWIGTVVFTLSAVIGTIWLSTAVVCVIVSLVLFAIGTVAFVSAFFRAVNRSRYEAIGMGGLYFLAGSTAPARVQGLLLGALGVQTVVAFTAASIRMYTGLAFGILVPMFGLGLAGLWGARYGRFAEREPEPVRPKTGRPKGEPGTREAKASAGKDGASSRSRPAAKKPPRVR